jgi:hypothetical protein
MYQSGLKFCQYQNVASTYKRADSPYIWIQHKDASDAWRNSNSGYRRDNPGDRVQAEKLAKRKSLEEMANKTARVTVHLQKLVAHRQSIGSPVLCEIPPLSSIGFPMPVSAKISMPPVRRAFSAVLPKSLLECVQTNLVCQAQRCRIRSRLTVFDERSAVSPSTWTIRLVIRTLPFSSTR